MGLRVATEADFEALLDFVEEAEIDRVGVFKFEPVSGSPARDFEGEVSDAEKDARYGALMEVAQGVSAGQLAKKVGRVTEVLVDDVRIAEGIAIARSKWDAPDIDGQVIVDQAHASAAQRNGLALALARKDACVGDACLWRLPDNPRP